MIFMFVLMHMNQVPFIITNFMQFSLLVRSQHALYYMKETIDIGTSQVQKGPFFALCIFTVPLEKGVFFSLLFIFILFPHMQLKIQGSQIFLMKKRCWQFQYHQLHHCGFSLAQLLICGSRRGQKKVRLSNLYSIYLPMSFIYSAFVVGRS